MPIAFSKKLKGLIHLLRLNKPIGIYLLLWPTLWALWLAEHRAPTLYIFLLFSFGVVLMRSAGCIINDFADRNLDGHITRTKDRPLVTGIITEKEAIILFIILITTSFLLVLTTNLLTLQIALIACVLTIIYPFAKRYTHLPQIILGAAFSCSIPMAYAAQTNHLNLETALLFSANLLWVIAYDTEYAMVDRLDDIKIGIKSTAVLLGDKSIIAIRILQWSFLSLLILIGIKINAKTPYYFALLCSELLFIFQWHLMKKNNHEQCFQAFLSNNWVGLIVFIGILFM